ncbi:hypothetical protein Q1695_000846 [Nippostrongylus brasiliensis]|nr:hypothetical protein Q1695_000846 [Nippostrongylus brasiliensis]
MIIAALGFLAVVSAMPQYDQTSGAYQSMQPLAQSPAVFPSSSQSVIYLPPTRNSNPSGNVRHGRDWGRFQDVFDGPIPRGWVPYRYGNVPSQPGRGY